MIHWAAFFIIVVSLNLYGFTFDGTQPPSPPPSSSFEMDNDLIPLPAYDELKSSKPFKKKAPTKLKLKKISKIKKPKNPKKPKVHLKSVSKLKKHSLKKIKNSHKKK
jgi:hypothetical protein